MAELCDQLLSLSDTLLAAGGGEAEPAAAAAAAALHAIARARSRDFAPLRGAPAAKRTAAAAGLLLASKRAPAFAGACFAALAVVARDGASAQGLSSEAALADLVAASGTGPAACRASALACAVNVLRAFAGPAANTTAIKRWRKLGGADATVAALGAASTARGAFAAAALLHTLAARDAGFALELAARRDACLAAIATLAWCYRAPDAPWPTGPGRPALAAELVRLLFALGSACRGASRGEGGWLAAQLAPDAAPATDDVLTTQLGALLTEALRRSHATPDSYKAKVAVVQLLMLMPKRYTAWLLCDGALAQLVQVLRMQLDATLIERGGPSAEVALAPVLTVLQTACECSRAARAVVKEALFPAAADAAWQERVVAEKEARAALPAGPAREAADAKARDARMHPVDAPAGTLRASLLQVLTSFSSSAKRLSAELVWAVCDGDADVFTLRCGLGNAVHTLQLRGLLEGLAGVDVRNLPTGTVGG